MGAMEAFRSMTDEELVHRCLELDRELVARRFLLHTGQLEDTASLRRLRKDLARAKTELRRRELDQGLPKDSLHRRYARTWKPADREAEGGGAGGFLSRFVDSQPAAE